MKNSKANKYVLFVLSMIALSFAVNCGEGNTETGKDGLDNYGDHYDAKMCEQYKALDRGKAPTISGFCPTGKSEHDPFNEVIKSREELKTAMNRVGCGEYGDDAIARLLPADFDFSNEVLAFVYAGQVSSGGTQTLIFAPEEGSSEIRYSRASTLETCKIGVVNTALAYPYSAIRLPKKEEGNYTFKKYDFPECGNVCVKSAKE